MALKKDPVVSNIKQLSTGSPKVYGIHTAYVLVWAFIHLAMATIQILSFK